MAKRGVIPTHLRKKEADLRITEEELYKKYGWPLDSSTKKNFPKFSMWEYSLFFLSTVALLFLCSIGGFFNLTGNIFNIIQENLIPWWVAALATIVPIVIFGELFYEFIANRGNIYYPTQGELWGKKLLSYLLGAACLLYYGIFSLIFIAVVPLFIIVQLNTGRTVAQRKKNFHEFLEEEAQKGNIKFESEEESLPTTK